MTMSKSVKKGIILAGGTGTRLFPVTKAVCKQLLPVYDKPMIYYPLATLMSMGITKILIITTPDDQSKFKALFSNGNQYGLTIDYAIQPQPNGIAEAFLIGEKFIGGNNVTLILGDNIFYGQHEFLNAANDFESGGVVFGYNVRNPERYGVVSFDRSGKVASIVEKPENPKSHYAVTGLYIYDSTVVEIAKQLKPSSRGELEITDINNAYLREGKLKVALLNRGVAWLDTGTHESMLEAGNFIETIEKRQGLKVACLEEIAFRMKFIDKNKFVSLMQDLGSNSYRDYLEIVLREAENAD